MNTRVYELNGRGTGAPLAINIPRAVLPEPSVQYVEEEELIPGYPYEYHQWVPFPLGSRQKDGRIAMLLDVGILGALNIDATKKIEIRLHGLPNIWWPSHRYHPPFRNRVHIPRKIVERLRLQPHTYYFAWVKGTTLPERRIRMVPRLFRRVTIEHLGEKYPADRIGEDNWRWIIPETLDCHMVMLTAFKMNITPIAECNKKDEDVIVDFAFTRPAGKIVSEVTDFAYRNLALRNYTATAKIDYPFLCEIRATYLTSCNKALYQPLDRAYSLKLDQELGIYRDGKCMPLIEALKITVYNMMQRFFQPAAPELPYSTLSYAEHIDAVDYVTTKVHLRKKYSYLPPTLYLEYETDSHKPEENQYYYCIKYVRVLNEQSYKKKNLDMYIYLNDEIEEEVIKKGIIIDENGFLWRE